MRRIAGAMSRPRYPSSSSVLQLPAPRSSPPSVESRKSALRLDGFCEGDLEVVVRVEADLFPARAAYPVDRLHEGCDVFAVKIAEGIHEV